MTAASGPEIPDAAREAALAGLHARDCWEDDGSHDDCHWFSDGALAAAWPHAGTAWLKWAAEQVAAHIRTPPGVEPSDYTKGLIFAFEALRRLADEIERGDANGCT